MPDNRPDTAPAIEIVGSDTEPSDSAVAALARLLLGAADGESVDEAPPQEPPKK